MDYLLDTNIVSELRKPSPNRGLLKWWEDVDPDRLFLSSLTVGEIQRGITALRHRSDHQQADRLELWIGGLIEQFAQRILAVTSAIAVAWGRLPVGKPMSTVDGLIAATAQVHGLAVVTRNAADFSPSKVKVHNPFG